MSEDVREEAMQEHLLENKTEVLTTHHSKRRLSFKAVLIAAAVLLVIAAIVFGMVKLAQWRNDGARYAERLSEQIGVSPETAQKYAHITLQNASQYATVNAVADDYAFLYESKKTVKVSGVSIPEWVIYLKEKNNTLTEVYYYDYHQLQQYGNGVKTKAHIETSNMVAGISPEAVREYIGFEPLRIYYSAKGMQEAYKYYYKDQNTGNTVSYILYIRYEDGQMVNVSEVENQFIISMLTIN